MNRSTKQFAVAIAVAAATITGLKADALFSLTVARGNPSGNYPAGAQITVSADAAPVGASFAGWTGDVAILTNPFLPTTTATVPSMAVKITATYTAPATNLSPAWEG